MIEPQNMRKLLQDWEEISKEKRTLWVVTGTYSAKSCALSVLSSSEASAVVGVEANVAEVAKAKPTAQWWKQDTDKTWMKYKDVSLSVLLSPLYSTDIRRTLA
jgi:trehalose-6-phosphatase